MATLRNIGWTHSGWSDHRSPASRLTISMTHAFPEPGAWSPLASDGRPSGILSRCTFLLDVQGVADAGHVLDGDDSFLFRSGFLVDGERLVQPVDQHLRGHHLGLGVRPPLAAAGAHFLR